MPGATKAIQSGQVECPARRQVISMINSVDHCESRIERITRAQWSAAFVRPPSARAISHQSERVNGFFSNQFSSNLLFSSLAHTSYWDPSKTSISKRNNRAHRSTHIYLRAATKSQWQKVTETHLASNDQCLLCRLANRQKCKQPTKRILSPPTIVHIISHRIS